MHRAFPEEFLDCTRKLPAPRPQTPSVRFVCFIRSEPARSVRCFARYDPDQRSARRRQAVPLDLPPERVHQLVAELEQLIAADLAHPGMAAPTRGRHRRASALSGPGLRRRRLARHASSASTAPAPAADALRVARAAGRRARFRGGRRRLARRAASARRPAGRRRRPADRARHRARAGARGRPPPVRRPYAAPERIAGAAWDRRAESSASRRSIAEMMTGRRGRGRRDAPTALARRAAEQRGFGVCARCSRARWPPTSRPVRDRTRIRRGAETGGRLGCRQSTVPNDAPVVVTVLWPSRRRCRGTARCCRSRDGCQSTNRCAARCRNRCPEMFRRVTSPLSAVEASRAATDGSRPRCRAVERWARDRLGPASGAAPRRRDRPGVPQSMSRISTMSAVPRRRPSRRRHTPPSAATAPAAVLPRHSHCRS